METNMEESPSFGMRVKEETPTKIVFEWWAVPSKGGIISFIRGLFLPTQPDTAAKTRNDSNVVLEETRRVDFEAQRATCIKVSRSGETEQTSLDLEDVSRVRIQMEEMGHHFRLYLDTPSSESFEVSIAFINSSYSPDNLVAHAKKIGKLLNKPVVHQHTDLGNLISEETIQI
jgi:hypothetical protein